MPRTGFLGPLDETGQLGRVLVVDAGWSARENVAGRLMLINLLSGAIVGEDLGVDTKLADAARDQLGIL